MSSPPGIAPMDRMPTPLARTWSAADAATFTKELRERLHALGVFRGDTPGYVRRALFVLIVTAGAWLGFIAVTTELEPAGPSSGLLSGSLSPSGFL